MENKYGSIANKYRELKREIEQIERIQRECNHVWGQAIYDPEEVPEYDYIDYRQGVDCGSFPVANGKYHYRERYVRVCTKCGKEKYSYPESRKK